MSKNSPSLFSLSIHPYMSQLFITLNASEESPFFHDVFSTLHSQKFFTFRKIFFFVPVGDKHLEIQRYLPNLVTEPLMGSTEEKRGKQTGPA